MQQTASVTHPHAVVTEFGRGLAQFDQRLILDGDGAALTPRTPRSSLAAAERSMPMFAVGRGKDDAGAPAGGGGWGDASDAGMEEGASVSAGAI